jgi:hypothetical protein
MFLNDKLFNPSILFVGKAESLPKSGLRYFKRL